MALIPLGTAVPLNTLGFGAILKAYFVPYNSLFSAFSLQLGTWKDGTETTSSTNKLNQRLQIKDEEHSEISTVSYQNKSLIVTVIIVSGLHDFDNNLSPVRYAFFFNNF